MANRQPENQQHPLAESLFNIRLRESRGPYKEEASETRYVFNVGSKTSCDFYEPDSAQHIPALTNIIVSSLLRDPQSSGLTPGFTVSSYASSLICAFLDQPTINQVKEMLFHGGLELKVIKVPSKVQSSTAVSTTAGDRVTSLLYFAQTVLMLFIDKNVTNHEADYQRYFDRKLSELIEKLKLIDGSQQIINPPPLVLTMEQARNVQPFLRVYIRRLVFERVMTMAAADYPDVMMRSVCQYICSAVAWTDMGAVILIDETLVVSNSPVLNERSVAGEVDRLGLAYEAIRRCRYPQFMRIVGSLCDDSLLWRGRFPALVAVAEKIRAVDDHI